MLVLLDVYCLYVSMLAHTVIREGKTRKGLIFPSQKIAFVCDSQ